MTSGIKVSHTTVHSLIRSVLSLWHEIHVLQATNAAETWQRGYELVYFLAWYSIFHRQAGLDEAWAKRRCRLIRYPLAANFTSWVGVCAEIVGPFKHLLRVTAHPQFLTLELRAPMGACPGRYGTCNPCFIHCTQEMSVYLLQVMMCRISHSKLLITGERDSWPCKYQVSGIDQNNKSVKWYTSH